MIFNDSWTEGLKPREQRLVVDYVLNGCVIKPELGGYKSYSSIKKFINSERGRLAVRAYCNYFFDKERDTVKLQLLKIYMQRAFFNPAEIINAKGMLKKEHEGDLKKLGDKAYCIDGIKVSTQSLEIKLCDRDKAMEFIAKLFDIYGENEPEKELNYKPVFEMTDEERDLEIEELNKKAGFLPSPEDFDNNNGNGNSGNGKGKLK